MQWVLRTGFIFRDYPESRNFAIVRPQQLGSQDQDIGRIEAVFREGVTDTPLEQIEYTHKGHPRNRNNILKLGSMFVDHPDTISATAVSRQYDRMKAFLAGRHRPARPLRDGFQRELTGFEQRITDAYSDTLDELSFIATENINFGMMRWMIVDQVI